jgi:predicted aconitase with swiveling domain
MSAAEPPQSANSALSGGSEAAKPRAWGDHASAPVITSATAALRVDRAYGPAVEGEAVVSEEGFSPRYDLDRWSGVITKPGHKLEGTSIKDKICFFPTAKGGIAAGWAFNDIKSKGIAPKAFIFGIANPVMIQGAIFAGITITEGWDRDPRELFHTGDWVRVEPQRMTITVVRRGQRGEGE